MKTLNTLALVVAVALSCAAPAQLNAAPALQSAAKQATNSAADAKTNASRSYRCAGTVVDAAARPVTGAVVESYLYGSDPLLAPEKLERKQQVTADANGRFELALFRSTTFVVARKSGLAPAWRQFNQPFDAGRYSEERLVLTPPAVLGGVVVDEADKPIADAEVFVSMAFSATQEEGGRQSYNYLSGRLARDLFSVRTGADGRFRIEGFPTNASANLAVKAAGKALREPLQQFSGPESMQCYAGADNIRLVVVPAGSIEGNITVQGATKPVPIAWLSLQPSPHFFGTGMQDQVKSRPDGTFRIPDVAAGSYHLRATFGSNAVPDWVAETVPVEVETGQPTRDVQIAAIRGAWLTVAVVGKTDHKPRGLVNVNAYGPNYSAGTLSDTNGLAALRLPPGEYQVNAFEQGAGRENAPATVEAGRTNHLEIEVADPAKVTGIVRGPDGQPAARLEVSLISSYSAGNGGVKTGPDGEFEMEWNPGQFGGQDRSYCILVRDPERNLAVAQEIDEDTGPLDLKLAPGLTLAGRAECNGKSLTNVTAKLIFWTGRSGMWLERLARTNAPGQYEIPALPPGRKYGVTVSAPGYGQKQLYDFGVSDEAIRQELDTVELKPANLTLAGQVLDADDQPVAGTFVNLTGEDQPNANVRADREGRFRFDHVCEGPARLYANARNSYGNISAEGGDTNVVLRLGQTYNNAPGITAHKLKGTVTDADGKPVAGAQVAVFPNNGTRWTKTTANGAFSLTWSLQPWQTQSGSALLVVRDKVRNLAATEEVSEDTTNLNVTLKSALTVTGLVRKADDSPMAGAQVSLLLKAGNIYEQLDEQKYTANPQGRYEIKCLPPGAHYTAYATAKGYGKSQRQIELDSETNRLELEPFVLKLADRVIAGQVLKDDDRPASSVTVQLNGEDQPEGNMSTDSKGRFHFQVCEGSIRLFAYSQSGGGNAQATVEAGDTNIVMNLSSSSEFSQPAPRRASFKGKPLPDLTAAGLAADAVPAGRPLLVCLFDAGQRPSRHVVRLLEQQVATIRQKNVAVLGVQAAAISDENFNEWKQAGGVSFPIGRVGEIAGKPKWTSAAPALPWLLLADANHRIIAEGFSLDDLDVQLKTLTK